MRLFDKTIFLTTLFLFGFVEISVSGDEYFDLTEPIETKVEIPENTQPQTTIVVVQTKVNMSLLAETANNKVEQAEIVNMTTTIAVESIESIESKDEATTTTEDNNDFKKGAIQQAIENRGGLKYYDDDDVTETIKEIDDKTVTDGLEISEGVRNTIKPAVIDNVATTIVVKSIESINEENNDLKKGAIQQAINNRNGLQDYDDDSIYDDGDVTEAIKEIDDTTVTESLEISDDISEDKSTTGFVGLKLEPVKVQPVKLIDDDYYVTEAVIDNVVSMDKTVEVNNIVTTDCPLSNNETLSVGHVEADAKFNKLIVIIAISVAAGTVTFVVFIVVIVVVFQKKKNKRGRKNARGYKSVRQHEQA
jgi:hypothetical protein